MKANELLRTLILATVLLIPFAAYAQDGEDVTSLYIINAGFDEDLTFQADGTKKAAINTETSLSDRSWAYITEDSTVYARPKDSSSQQRPDGRKAEAVNGFIGWIKGWKPITNQDYPMCEWIYYGAVPYSIGADAVPISDDSNTFLTAPDKLSAYNTEDNIGALYLRSGWGNQCNYQQTTTLPKGSYQLEYWTININSSSSAEAEDITNVSFKDESTEVVFKDDSGTAFSSHEWVKHSISFSLKEATECTLTFGFKAANAGSNANPWICIDGVKLIATDSSSTTPEIITFADAKVKEICVANWDTDGDGELSYDEAAAVTDLGTLFTDNLAIDTFDELQYFTGLTSISDKAFYACNGLTSIIIPEGVKSIGTEAFLSCFTLTSLTIPNTLISIGSYAFVDCKGLTTINIPNSVTTIGDGAFAYCSGLSGSIIIPESVTSIESGIFSGCNNLTSIIIPESVTTIGTYAFSGCSSLTSISIPDGVTSIGSEAFRFCSSLISIDIPNGVKIIEGATFEGCSSLISVTIPDGLEEIGIKAFNACSSLTSISIPKSVGFIKKEAFLGCENLVSVIVKITTPISLPNDAFSIYDTATLYVPVGYKQDYVEAEVWKQFAQIEETSDSTIIIFADAQLRDNCISLWDTNGDGLLSYEEAAAVTDIQPLIHNVYWELKTFDELQYFTGLTSIADNAFMQVSNNLSSIILPESVTSIGNLAFSGCIGLTSINIPESVTNIGYGAFLNCSGLTSITIPNSVTSIGEGVFSNCTGLTSITIPNSVTSIGKSALNGCSNLTSVILSDGVSNICEFTFMNCSSLESITIPNGVTNIGEYAFYGCSSLTSVTIPNGVSKIADRTFSGCEKLYSITLPESITEIEGKAFQNCSSLTNVTIPNNVANIGSNAFEGCSSLTSIVIPEGVRDIEARTFLGCESLTSVSIPTSVSNISEYAFYGCKSLTDIIIPDNMIWIRKEAFRGCSSLVSITIPEKVTVLDYSDNVFDSVFADCTRLLSINWNSNSPLSISKYFTSTSNTANRLFYINSDAEVIDDENEDIRPIIIRNGQIDEINLFDNEPLYIPEPFTAQHISYTHNFSKETQRGVASGWESLVLPFDVQSISCDSVGIVPFGANAVGYSKFWLAEVNPETGFTAATSIKANKPYILAMPNSTEYGSGNITGSVIFSATNVTVQPTSNEKTECAAFALTPCWSHINDTDSTYNEIYVLNDSTYTAPNQTVYPAGSVFVRSLRPVRPFEAYYTPANGAGVKEFFPISEMENGIRPTPNPSREGRGEAGAVYDLSGRRSLSPSPSPVREGRAGVYIKDGRKIMVK